MHVFHREAALGFEDSVRFYRERGKSVAARFDSEDHIQRFGQDGPD